MDTLKELNNGDIFIHAKSRAKNPTRYVVYGNPTFNRGHGSSTRNCLNPAREVISKSCRLEVIKKGTSLHADKIKQKFDPQPQPSTTTTLTK